MKARYLYPAVLCVLLGGLLMSAADYTPTTKPGGTQSFFDRLITPDITRFTLTFDLEALPAMKRTEDYFPATFSHAGDNWDAQVKVRGRYRRRVCEFPPLKLKLSKDMLEAAGLQRHNKFKLVTHCSDDFDNNDNVLREQLAYDMYHLLTGEGFRTQLVQVTYRNARTGEETERFGILIEDTDEMAQANGGEECEDCINLNQDQYVPGNLEQVTLFQYLIGNADYGLLMPRNIKHVRLSGGGYKAVPYDFDFSGLVDAEYAVANPDYGQASVKDRVWIWEFDQAPQMAATVARFKAKESELLQLIANYPHLSTRGKRQITKYVGDFYRNLDNMS